MLTDLLKTFWWRIRSSNFPPLTNSLNNKGAMCLHIKPLVILNWIPTSCYIGKIVFHCICPSIIDEYFACVSFFKKFLFMPHRSKLRVAVITGSGTSLDNFINFICEIYLLNFFFFLFFFFYNINGYNSLARHLFSSNGPAVCSSRATRPY